MTLIKFQWDGSFLLYACIPHTVYIILYIYNIYIVSGGHSLIQCTEKLYTFFFFQIWCKINGAFLFFKTKSLSLKFFLFCIFVHYVKLSQWEFLPWEIWVAFPKESQLQQSSACYPALTNYIFQFHPFNRICFEKAGSLIKAKCLSDFQHQMSVLFNPGIISSVGILSWYKTCGAYQKLKKAGRVRQGQHIIKICMIRFCRG